MQQSAILFGKNLHILSQVRFFHSILPFCFL